MIEAPEPGSRSTSRRTFAPFLMACSAWVRCVLGSPWAFTIVASTPAALKASPRYFLSNCSQRTDDFVSGSSTATLPADPPLLPLLVLVLPLELLLSSEPQPATTS